ncbi:c-type cytochrome domain-containing protein [Pedobacter sp. B4-66]|uniref:c-type cytochrome domain-containing protein n=1 Tax=Pedobacter sp. B4-66 TaxID=2817280 RepID=UPI001BD9CD6A|nr:c-type cytochrome domain-containing protein [Pedobacter sp. B4-66]
MILLDIFTFSGRLHPLIVHLPIGFILLATLFNILSYLQKYRYLKQSVPLILLIGFVAAVLACVFGYVLSLSGDYDADTLSHHKFSGITLAIICGLLYFSSTSAFRNYLHVGDKLFSALLLGLVVLMSYSGHQGASLTHGNDYLTFHTLMQQEREKPATVEQAMLFEDVIEPILQKKCIQCHRDGKQKGELSLESLAALKKGGKNGQAVVPGKPDASELFKRITLDEDHKDFMPADGKPPLTKNEVKLITWWIKEGKAEGGKTIAEIKNTTALKPMVALFLGIGGLTDSEEDGGSEVSQVINPDLPLAVDTAIIAQLKNKGIRVRIMLNKPVMLDVTLPPKSGIKVADVKTDILKLAKNIVWLNFSDNQLTDQDLDFLPSLANLEKLRLDKNPVTDRLSDYLISMKHLEAVNLNETKITDAITLKLKKNPGIKRVYSWKTSIAEIKMD